MLLEPAPDLEVIGKRRPPGETVHTELLAQHLEHCVQDAVGRGAAEADEEVEEASAAIATRPVLIRFALVADTAKAFVAAYRYTDAAVTSKQRCSGRAVCRAPPATDR